MVRILLAFIGFWSFSAFAVPCDCEVRVHAPTTGPHNLLPVIIKRYTLEDYSSFAVKNQLACRQSCYNEFHRDMGTERLRALLLTYTQEQISNKTLGYNCTGLTTLKYPVRVRAKLSQWGIGNVIDQLEVVTHEEVCF